MKCRKTSQLVLLFALSIFYGCTEQPTEASRPNIIMILSDDMGYSDIGCYGGEVNTPHLDQLAENGLRYTQFYNTARCCPTRASLLTGLYPHQAGMGWMTANEFEEPGYAGNLNRQCVTLAEVAKSAGYATYMTGKWHVSSNIRAEGEKHTWPLQRGFDRFYGTITGAGSYYDPATLCRENALTTPSTDSLYQPDQYYYTDAITHEAVRFINEHNQDKPFFMYMAYTAAHWPMHAKQKDIEKYEGVYDKGWEAIRQERFQRMRELGVIDANAELSPLDVHPWAEEESKGVKVGRMEVYAAMVDAMDQGIGQVVEALKRKGVFENTLILYLQDNGGCAEEIGTQGETRPWADNPDNIQVLYEDEIEYAVIPRITRYGALVMRGEGIAGGSDSTYVAYGKVWANASNTPFREYKHWVHEGGIATPLIAHWPAGIKEKGALRTVPGHVIDIMPTLVELTGATYPSEYKDNSIKPMEGVSLVPTFEDKPVEREAIYWEHEMNRAVRMGDWKLVSKGELLNGVYGHWKNYQKDFWELYNIQEDRSELHDLAEKYPEKVSQMSQMWEDYAQRANVFPAPWKPIVQKEDNAISAEP